MIDVQPKVFTEEDRSKLEATWTPEVKAAVIRHSDKAYPQLVKDNSGETMLSGTENRIFTTLLGCWAAGNTLDINREADSGTVVLHLPEAGARFELPVTASGLHFVMEALKIACAEPGASFKQRTLPGESPLHILEGDFVGGSSLTIEADSMPIVDADPIIPTRVLITPPASQAFAIAA